MNIYEITFIIKEEKSDFIKDTIKSYQGNILSEKILGRKKFAYPIKKESAGFYKTIVFEMKSESINKLNRELTANQETLRHLLISYQKEYSAEEINQKLNKPKKLEFEKKRERTISEDTASIDIVDDKKTEIKEVEKKKTTDIKSSKTEKVVTEKIQAESEIIEDSQIQTKNIKEKSKDIKKKNEASAIKEEVLSDRSLINKKDEKDKETKILKPKINIPQPKKEAISEEERMAKLEEKLDELLKD